MSKLLLPVGIMTGAIIGAGIFSLPYVFVQVGVINGLLFLFFATIALTIIHLLYADLVLRTEGEYNFVGFARIYLGRAGLFLGIITAVVEMLLVLVIYLILSQSFFNLIFTPASLQGGPSPITFLFFWGLGTVAIFATLKKLAWLEFLITVGMVGIISLIFIVSLPSLPTISLKVIKLPLSSFIFPIGPILFALAGRVAVISAIKSAGKQVKKVKKMIIWGTAIPAIVYAIFVLAVVGLSKFVSEDAVSGLVGQLPLPLLVLIGVLGLLSLWSSYIIIGFNINNILKIDLRWPIILRGLIVGLVPLLLFLIGFQDFIGLVAFTGGIFFALEAILIIIMWLKAPARPILFKKMPLVVIIFLIILFTTVLINQIYVQILEFI